MTGPVWQGADDRLTRCASALLALAEREDGSYDDVTRFGAPSECMVDVRRATEAAGLRVLAEHGYTRDELEAALQMRTSDRFVCLGLGGWLLSVLPETAGGW